MCIRDRIVTVLVGKASAGTEAATAAAARMGASRCFTGLSPVSYTHLRAHETVLDIVCRLLLEKKKRAQPMSCSCTKLRAYATDLDYDARHLLRKNTHTRLPAHTY